MEVNSRRTLFLTSFYCIGLKTLCQLLWIYWILVFSYWKTKHISLLLYKEKSCNMNSSVNKKTSCLKLFYSWQKLICLSLFFQDFHDAIAGCDTKVQKAFAEMELLSNTAEGNMSVVLQNHVSRPSSPPVLLMGWQRLTLQYSEDI